MRAADTNILVRLISRDDARQFTVAERYVEQGVWISNLVVAETIWVLTRAYGRDHNECITAVTMLLENASIAFEDRDVVTAALAEYRTNPRLGFSDCLILEIAKKAGHLPLGTFDRHLGKLPHTERL